MRDVRFEMRETLLYFRQTRTQRRQFSLVAARRISNPRRVALSRRVLR
jgi:hypothetical protein